MKKLRIIQFLIITTIFFVCKSNRGIHSNLKNTPFYFESEKLRLEIDNAMGIKVYHKVGEKQLSLSKSLNPYYVVVNGVTMKDFVLDKSKTKLSNVVTQYGKGKRLLISGEAIGPFELVIEKEMQIEIYDNFPNAAVISVVYTNVNSTPSLSIDEEINSDFKLNASEINKNYTKNNFWIFQGGSYNSRPDWVLPVTGNFSFENYQGQRYSGKTNNSKKASEMELADTQPLDGSEVGGGIPVIDVWCKETGFFIGSLRKKPTLISLPAHINNDGMLNISIHYKRNNVPFSDQYTSIPTVIGIHDGDYYNGLKLYAGLMACNGLKMPQPSEDSYKPIWCGWGFGPDFTQQQMTDMIPLARKLEFQVVTVDAGWFYNNGDFRPRDDTFPGGEEDMKSFVQKFHDAGLKVKLWITTHIAGPELEKAHPEWLIRDRNGNKVGFTYLGTQVTPYLCPALKEVQEYHRALVRKIIGEWDFDGFKVDQSLINSVAKCYAEEHHHQAPEESVEALPKIYKAMYEEMIKLKPDAIFEVCPCGMVPSFYKMPWYNQPVSSDFNTPWQIRHRGKTIKALMGANAAFFGDHVERHYSENNLPSMIGVGGIPGSMMVSRPEDNVEFLRVKYPCYLSPEREKLFEKWVGIYNEYQLSKGEYVNLYDIAYDKPEAHAITKDGNMYYAFYADQWQGEVEFRGLENKNYTIIDYVNEKELGTIYGNSKLNVDFDRSLLVKAIPQ